MKVFASIHGSGLSLGALLFTTMSTPANAGERPIKPSAVPAAVHEAVKTAHPDAHVVGYAREEEHGKVTYEVTVRAGNRVTDVSLSPEGRILAEEERIPKQALPDAVAKAFAASAYGSSRIERIERVVEGTNREEPRFEIVIKDRGAFVELTFDRTGALLKRERTREP
jgi:hypothetical protein